MDVTLISKVHAELERLLVVAEAAFPGHIFPKPSLQFRSLGNRAGIAHLGRNAISFNGDLLTHNPGQVLRDTLPHELAHLIHFAIRSQDFYRGSRLGHGRIWKAIARKLGLANPTRCFGADDATRAALGMRQAVRHSYRCAYCATVVAIGPRVHAKLQRGSGFRYQFVACGHSVDDAIYLGKKT
jgi:SprT protein